MYPLCHWCHSYARCATAYQSFSYLSTYLCIFSLNTDRRALFIACLIIYKHFLSSLTFLCIYVMFIYYYIDYLRGQNNKILTESNSRFFSFIFLSEVDFQYVFLILNSPPKPTSHSTPQYLSLPSTFFRASDLSLLRWCEEM